ncbi:HAMP domain-containing protein [Candidatus Dependentiae bacterium]|nr:HAMP domain-containing protein [Candidatus Dependentiae bacterium]
MNNSEKSFQRYYYQIPINGALLTLSIALTLLVQRYEQNIGGGISRPFLFLLINLEVFIAILLAVSIIRQSVILFLERRQDRPGSVFKKNLLFSFIFLSILPGTFIFLGAGKLVVRHLNLWFGTRIEQGLMNGLTVYEQSTTEKRYHLQRLGTALTTKHFASSSLPQKIEDFEVYWWPNKNNTYDVSTEVAQWRTFREFNDRPIKNLRAAFFSLFKKTAKDNEALIDFFGSTYWIKAYPSGMLAIIYRPPAPLRNALIKIQNAQTDYMNIRAIEHGLKFNFYLQAVLLLFLVLILSIWCSFYLARGISEPIQKLLEATNKVRAGDVNIHIETTGSRDLQALTTSFNEMTKTLAFSKQELDEKNKELIAHSVKINTFKTWQEAVNQIAHEIKNPLTPIQLTTQRLQRKCLPSLSEENRAMFNEGCAMILNQVETIKKLVADFSSFAVSSRLEKKLCLLEPLIAEVVQIFNLSYPVINITCNIEHRDHQLILDADRIKRVLINLLTNSIEALKNTQHPYIEITVKIVNKQTVITIRDNGHGIEPKIMDKLFLPYISSSKKNMGLGLAIAHQIIMQHGGSILATKSNPGALFTIKLPCNDKAIIEI